MSRRHIPAAPHVAPRAYVDPVDDAEAALAVFRLAVSDPPVHETLAFLLDHDGRGGTIVAVSETTAPEALFTVVGAMCCMARRDREACSLVVATVRPDDVVVAGDVDRWSAATELADSYGIELVEWFVITPGDVVVPRASTGEPERW